MIIDLPDTSTGDIARRVMNVRDEGGAFALARVLTLVISVAPGGEEEAIAAANRASNEHPMRIIAVLHEGPADEGADGRLDAQLRVGSDAGASEVLLLQAFGAVADDDQSIVTGLLLPDAPVVAWWPGDAPSNTSLSSLGRLAQRRITDAGRSRDGFEALQQLKATYAPGDTDFSWTRLTAWRTQLAAVLDDMPSARVDSASVAGSLDSASVVLLGTWLSHQLRVAVDVEGGISPSPQNRSVLSVTLRTESGDIVLRRLADGDLVELSQPGRPSQYLSLPRRSLADCLTEELRRMDADGMFGRILMNVPDAQPHAGDCIRGFLDQEASTR